MDIMLVYCLLSLFCFHPHDAFICSSHLIIISFVFFTSVPLFRFSWHRHLSCFCRFGHGLSAPDSASRLHRQLQTRRRWTVETPKNISHRTNHAPTLSWNIECVRQYFCFGASASPQNSEGKKQNNGWIALLQIPPRPNLAIVSSISSGTIRGIYFPTLYFSILPGMYSGLLSAIHFGIYFGIHSGRFFPFSLTSYCGILLAF